MAMLVDEVISGIKARSIFATNQITIDQTQLLAFINSVIQLDLVTLIDSTNQEFFVRDLEEPLVAGQSAYKIPYRAIGRVIRDIKFHDTDGDRLQNMILININDLQYYKTGFQNFAGFYFKGDKIVVVPDVPTDVSDTAALQIWYKLKPNRPCVLDDSATVVSVSAPNVTVNQIPSNLSVGSLIDFIQGKEGCDIYSYDQEILNIAGTTITFGDGVIPSDLQEGDYISLRQTSPVINMIPDEAQPLIENRTSRLLLKSIGDLEGAETWDGEIKEMTSQLMKLLEPRTDGQPKVILNRNSLARGRRYWAGLYGGGGVISI